MTDPAGKIRERPLLRPWVSLDPEPVLFYADSRGHMHALDLREVDLAYLALSLAEAQSALAYRGIDVSERGRSSVG